MRRPFYLAVVLLTLALLFFVPLNGPRHPVPKNSFQEPVPHLKAPDSLKEYEPLIREAAGYIGWDWRLVASVIYHESRFDNNAQSSKGATGLMQIRSSRYSEDTLLNPVVNIAIGTAYLKKLDGMFRAASRQDSVKFALAAYNFGDGNIRRLIDKADSSGLDPTYWNLVAHMLPEGHHTPEYVEKVLRTYERYCEILPR